ncbi:MAG TPA: hypothetical protein VFG73_08485 [Rhodanobacteraceae bacterium]|nr:hypothetical protein [Rhodanobacteraceae bacterium]
MTRKTRIGILILALLFSAAASAGPIDWLRSKLAPPAAKDAPVQVMDAYQGPVTMKTDEAVHVRIDASTPTAKLPGGTSHYRRFMLPREIPHAMVRVRVLTQRHDDKPRFTVFAPKLYVLDDAGDIRRGLPVAPLNLSIRPFRPAELQGCLRVDNLRSFLVGDNPGELGKIYEFNARPVGASVSSDGFYRGSPTMDVYLPYAKTGEMVLRVMSVDEDAQCS